MVVGEERADTADMMWNLEPRSEAGSGNWEQKGSDSLLQPPERTSLSNIFGLGILSVPPRHVPRGGPEGSVGG